MIQRFESFSTSEFVMRCLLALTVLFALVAPAFADEKMGASDFLARGKMRLAKRQYADAIADFTKCIDLDPKNVEAYDQRGSAHFMAGKFAESVADFDKQIKLDPKKADQHWRRGISLYYAGKYEEGAKQFLGDKDAFADDVENAVWHFTCVTKKDGKKKARESILKIGKDGRTPMMEVYDLYKGKIEPDDVLKAANAGDLTDEQRKPQLFYAHLYLGIHYDLEGDSKKAIEHLDKAANKYKIGHYMGEVARVHHELLTKKQKEK
jgi:lipoprotein NlpI